MSLKLGFLLGFWLMAYSALDAQPLPGNMAGAGTGINLSDHMLILDSKKNMDVEPEEIIGGTPYLIETFTTGDVYSNKGKFAAVPMRYNIYADYIEFKEKDVTYILAPGPDIKKVNLGDYHFVVEKYQVKGKTQLGYFTLLDSGKVMLMSKKMVTFRGKQEPKAIETAGTPARYTRSSDEYHYKIANGALIKVSSIKKMIESFPDKQEELKQFASQEKISPKNESELVKLVRYYNSL